MLDSQQRLGFRLREHMRRCGATLEWRDQRAGEDFLGANARRGVPFSYFEQWRIDLRARVNAVTAARRKAATVWGIAQIGWQPFDGFELDPAREIEPRDRAHQPDGIRVRGLEKH